MKKIDSDTLSALQSSTTVAKGDQYFLKLGGQVERDIYTKVKDALAIIGGPWITSKQAHVFNYNPATMLAQVLATGELPDANPGDFFPTPSAVVDQMIDAAMPQIEHILFCLEIGQPVHILEPSGGVGGIVHRVITRFPQLAGHITSVEMDPLKCGILRALNAGPVINADFLTWETETRFDLVLMNPPFSKPRKNVYVDHVRRAYDLLTICGEIFAITPTNWLDSSDKALDVLHDLVAHRGEYVRLPAKAFAESGTNVKTTLIKLDHAPQDDRNLPVQGYSSDHAMNLCLCIETSRAIADLTEGEEPDMETIIDALRSAIPEVATEDRPFPRDPAVLEAASHDLLAIVQAVMADNRGLSAPGPVVAVHEEETEGEESAVLVGCAGRGEQLSLSFD